MVLLTLSRTMLLLSLLLLLASACSVARPLIDQMIAEEEENADKREPSKLHRRALGNLKQLIDEIVRSGYADGGAAFRPGR